jgi:quercetin dioxygenase-like cupin family protein
MSDVFHDIEMLPVRQIWEKVVARDLQGERVSLGIVELAPNSLVPEHSHSNEQLGLVIRGALTFRISGEVRELGPGGTWRIPPNLAHEVRAGPEGAVVVDVFSPRRDDWARLPPLESVTLSWPEPG